MELVETHVKKKAFLNVLCQHKELYELTEDRLPKGGRRDRCVWILFNKNHDSCSRKKKKKKKRHVM